MIIPHSGGKKPPVTPTWTRFFVYRAEGVRTTWALRLGVMALLVIVPWSTSACWTAALGRSLVCEASIAPSDAILVENFDPDYLLFERARQLRRGGLAPRVLVPVPTDRGTEEPNDVALGFAEVMARISGVGPIDVIPIRQVEPISLNAARDIQRYLERERIRSVIVVDAPLPEPAIPTRLCGHARQRRHCRPLRARQGLARGVTPGPRVGTASRTWGSSGSSCRTIAFA